MSRGLVLVILVVVSFALATLALDSNDVLKDDSSLEKRLPTCAKIEKSACQKWKRRGFCKASHVYFRYMRKFCPGACGFCRLPKKPEVKKPTLKGARTVPVNRRECLRAHNSYRTRHGAPFLEWNKRMAVEAQRYALKLARQRRMAHASGIPDGENLAMQQTYGDASKYTCAQATKQWYDEIKDYNFDKPGFSGKTGHFTQVVWKSSKRLGVGIAKNGGFTIVVARYSPPGNYRGQFQENVKRPRY